MDNDRPTTCGCGHGWHRHYYNMRRHGCDGDITGDRCFCEVPMPSPPTTDAPPPPLPPDLPTDRLLSAVEVDPEFAKRQIESMVESVFPAIAGEATVALDGTAAPTTDRACVNCGHDEYKHFSAARLSASYMDCTCPGYVAPAPSAAF